MSEVPSWEQKWRKVEPLDSGGQGLTWVVEPIDGSGPKAVMKLLKKTNVKARRRMFQEVANLRTLNAAGVKIPKVLDDNTAHFDKEIALYFVMELIPGNTFEKAISGKGKQSVEQSVALTLDLCRAVGAAHREKVLHRDIKPGNIIARDFDNADLVIVDFGLSFNQDDPPDVSITEPNEPVGNRFLQLPEARGRGGDRRDHRSDLTYLCGVLYYCLTGHVPDALFDGKSRPPHQTDGYSIREALAGDPRIRTLEVFFDVGFAPDVASRFQSAEQLESRLKELVSPTPATEDLNNVAKKVTERLLAHNAQIRLIRFKQSAEAISARLEAHLKKQRRIEGFRLRNPSREDHRLPLPSGAERLVAPMTVIVFFDALGEKARGQAIFEFVVMDQQPCVLWASGGVGGKFHDIHFGLWQEPLRYTLELIPTDDELVQCCSRALVSAIRHLEEALLD